MSDTPPTRAPLPSTPSIPQWQRITSRISAGLFLLFPLLWLSSSPVLHVDRKMFVLWAWGALSGCSLLFQKHSHRPTPWQRIYKLLLALILIQLAISTLLSVDSSNSLLGGKAYRIGAISTSAFLLISLHLRPHAQKLLPLLYFQSLALTLFSLFLDHSTWPYGYRLRGPTYQPNILAAHLAIGILIGFVLLRDRHKDIQDSLYHNTPLQSWFENLRPYALWLAQTILCLGLWLTQSRGAFILLLLFSIPLLTSIIRRFYRAAHKHPQKTPHRWKTKTATILVLLGLLALAGSLAQQTLSRRFIPSNRWIHAIHYRGQLQHHGLLMLGDMPWHGWGPDSIIYVFGGLHPLPSLLQRSFHKGVRFDSTHNWYLDKFLELGWMGGALYLLLLILALYRGFSRGRHSSVNTCTTLLLFLSIRYFWSVSMMELELLYWFLLSYALNQTSRPSPTCL